MGEDKAISLLLGVVLVLFGASVAMSMLIIMTTSLNAINKEMAIAQSSSAYAKYFELLKTGTVHTDRVRDFEALIIEAYSLGDQIIIRSKSSGTVFFDNNSTTITLEGALEDVYKNYNKFYYSLIVEPNSNRIKGVMIEYGN